MGAPRYSAARVEPLLAALRNLEANGAGGCEKVTSGIGDCFRVGMTADAEYLADRACGACVANRALVAWANYKSSRRVA